MRNFQKSYKKITILCIVLGLIILGLIMRYYTISKKNTVNESVSKDFNFVSDNAKELSELQKCKYEIFQPTFKQEDGSNYDLRDEMEEQDMILYKKIDTYQEYVEIKSKWNDILDMNEYDFENSFMVITSVWNKDMIGLVVDNIETDQDTLYISLIKDVEMNEEEQKKIGIAYIIPRDMERDHIVCVRNFDDKEKDFNTGMKIGKLEEDITSPNSFHYRDTEFQKKVDDSYANSSGIKYNVVEQDWKDMMYENFVIKSNMQDIDFNNWSHLGDEFYFSVITDYSEYLKLMKNYNIKNLTWHDFQYIYALVIVNADPSNIVKIDNLTQDTMENLYLPIYAETNHEVDEDIKYQGIVIMLPNYMKSTSHQLKIKLK